MNWKTLMANWKTTSAGTLMIAAAAVHMGYAISGKTLTPGTLIAEISSIVGGIGLIFAGDASQSAPNVPGAGTAQNPPPPENKTP
jgi:hypothetical protein